MEHRRRQLAIVAIALMVASWLAWALWYFEAGDFSDSAVSGTYVFQTGGGTTAITLRPDHTFQQERSRSRETKYSNGTWRVFGEGQIAFSDGFVAFPGQFVGRDGTAYGQIKNWFGIVSITFSQDPDGLTLHRTRPR